METLGQRIKRLREQHRWSQAELATLLSVSTRSISNWERGENIPRNRIGALEELFGTKLEGQIVPEAPAGVDPVVAAIQASPLTTDRQYDVIGYYMRSLREQTYEDERRRGSA